MKPNVKSHRIPDPLQAWHLNPVGSKDYDFIDGLRGLAILLVLGCHLVYINPKSNSTAHFIAALASAGSSGVTLFFALSGFLISWPFWRRKIAGEPRTAPPGYLRRRFFKIYPPLALSILFFTPCYIAQTHDLSYIQTAVKWLIGVPVFFPISGQINPVMWSLIIEVQFYVTLPILMLMLHRIPARICLFLLPATLMTAGLGRRFWENYIGYHHSFSVLDFPFPSNLDVFSLGVFVAGLHSSKLLDKRHSILGTAGIILFIAIFPIVAWLNYGQAKTFMQWEIVMFAVKVSCGLTLFFVANPSCKTSQMLSNSALRWFGLFSYEWYLFHQPIIYWVRNMFGSLGGNVFKYSAELCCSFLISLFVAAIIYRSFSLPILRLARSKE